MKRLTGKRSIKSYEVAPKSSVKSANEIQKAQTSQTINFTNKAVFNEMING